MKIHFEGNQEYQLEAIASVVNLFEGQPRVQGQFAGKNRLTLDEETILHNLQAVQRGNGLPESESLDNLNFSVEMETGTGKTYVYLRTIHQLYHQYGLTKYIIVVPSVAIREGVLKNLEITADHLRTLYGNHPFDYAVYDSKKLSTLRQFALSNQLQILVLNIDAFNKKANNVIYRENDLLNGRQPLEFIQGTYPIVILDEPQNMESPQAKAAIQSLNPLCTLRYSATHRERYKLIYRLDPVKAYEMRLVKRIEVDSVLEEEDFNAPFIRLESITPSLTKVTAKLTLNVQQKGKIKRSQVSVSQNGIDLYDLSGQREEYRGYIVDTIEARTETLSFTNGVCLKIGEAIGGYGDEIMKAQIRETIKEHLERELQLRTDRPEGKRLKVLSLFFIDRVAHYADKDGKIRRWFEEIYQDFKEMSRYQELSLPRVEEVHNGYFAQVKGKAKDTTGQTKADDEAYELIMRDKERLLAIHEPLRFIFSHSALREGWDNPNVFQICTLNETRSEIKKRQEIGRGLRLPLDETGHRVIDPGINRLTIIANESYHTFAKALQQEMEEECGVSFRERIHNKREGRSAKLENEGGLTEDFLTLWEKIKAKTRYAVEFDSEKLMKQGAKAVSDMPLLEKPKISTLKRRLDLTENGIEEGILPEQEHSLTVAEEVREENATRIPDLITPIERETNLTRSTIAEILIRSGRLQEVWLNPQQFLLGATKVIKHTLQRLLAHGIKYEKIGNEYRMRLLDEAENLTLNLSEFKASEGQMVQKIPPWFKVDTPLGTYHPDWALLRQTPAQEDEKLYLVRMIRD